MKNIFRFGRVLVLGGLLMGLAGCNVENSVTLREDATSTSPTAPPAAGSRVVDGAAIATTTNFKVRYSVGAPLAGSAGTPTYRTRLGPQIRDR